MTSSQTCPKCGTPFKPGANFCAVCGSPAPLETSPPAGGPTRRAKAPWWTWVALVVGLVVVAAGLAQILGGDKPAPLAVGAPPTPTTESAPAPAAPEPLPVTAPAPGQPSGWQPDQPSAQETAPPPAGGWQPDPRQPPPAAQVPQPGGWQPDAQQPTPPPATQTAQLPPASQAPPVQQAPEPSQAPPAPAGPPARDAAAAVRLTEAGLQQARAGNLDQAMALFQQAVEADPQNGQAWNNLGLTLRKKGLLEDAVGAYFKAIEAQPDLAVAYKNLGLALEQVGYLADAAIALRKYCELNPSAPDLASVKATAARLEKAAAAKGGTQ